MSSLAFVVVDVDGPARPKQADWRELIRAVMELPPGKAIRVEASEAGPEGSFRSGITQASMRLGATVSTNKHDGYYTVQRRFDMTA